MTKIKALKDIRLQEVNANRHTPTGMGLLEGAIGRDGWIGAITVAADGETFDGSARREVLETAGLDAPIVVETDGKRPVVVVRTDIANAGDPRAKRLAVEANQIASRNYDPDPAVLAALAEEDGAIRQLWGVEEWSALMEAMNAPEVGAGGDEFDPTPEEGETRTNLGDLWVIGGVHKLAVGDCTDPAVVGRLMGGERAEMVFTDPPYGVDYEGGRNPESNTPREKLAGDTSGRTYYECMSVTSTHCFDSAPWYIWFAGSIGKPVYDAVDVCGYTVRAMIVWNKLDPHYGNFMAQYMQRHEPCLYCVKDTPPWHGPTNEVTVWDVKQPTVNEFQPTQKPIELPERAIRNSSKRGALVCDWFLGSGTTLIAAHRTGRRCYGCEISPKYADVILRRAEAEGLTVERAVD
jgi:Fe2+ transport system protein FeoA